MAGKGSGAKRLGQPTLTAADWAQAALQLIAEAGLGALTVEALAARLGVTKGSFYWHFSGRSDLLAAALALGATDHHGGHHRALGCHRRAAAALSNARRGLAVAKIPFPVRRSRRGRRGPGCKACAEPSGV